MKVSIIIPIYNVAPYIVRCIDSVIAQSYPHIELILVNDCSPDKSMEMAQETLQKSAFSGSVKYITHEENRGLSAARNTGIIHATGEYLYFLDSDDAITPTCIELLASQIGTHDFAIANYKLIGSTHTYPPLKLADGAVVKGRKVLHSYIAGMWYMMAFNKLVKRSLVINGKLYFPEGLIHEDQLWGFMLAATATSFVVIQQETYLYYIREGSITTGQNSRRKVMDHGAIYKKLVSFSLQKRLTSNRKVVGFLNSFAKFLYISLIHLLDKEERKALYLSLRAAQLRYYKPFITLPRSIDLHLLLPSNASLYYFHLIRRAKRGRIKLNKAVASIFSSK